MADFPRLLADIGGTNARFALETAPRRFEAMAMYPNRDFPGIEEALTVYMAHQEAIDAGMRLARHAALAIANPVEGDVIRMTNSRWTFSIEEVRKRFGFDTLLVVNDFAALATAVPLLASHQFRQVGSGTALAGKTIGLLGAGTGLGVSGLVWSKREWIALETEGGHVTLPPADEREAELLRQAWRLFPHVSAERFLSGMGLELIHRLLAGRAGVDAGNLTAPEIARRALAGDCEICDETIETFCAMLGTVAGNLALTLGAKGGVYIGGGIVPRLGERFDCSLFRQRFERKGRFSSYLSSIPTYVITDPQPAFAGVAALLEKRLQER